MDNRTVYKPKNVLATFLDEHGDERVIHRPKGRGNKSVRVAHSSESPILRLNRAAAILIGEKIQSRRNYLGVSQKELCLRAGLHNVNPKQYISSIERATRQHGIRLGTLYAIAIALECEPACLLPTRNEVMEAGGADFGDRKILTIE